MLFPLLLLPLSSLSLQLLVASAQYNNNLTGSNNSKHAAQLPMTEVS